MSTRRTRWLLLGVLALLGVHRALSSNPDAQLEQRLALIRPDAAETAYRRIPWMTSLWKGRQRAAREGKPILLWTMDGNPLGET